MRSIALVLELFVLQSRLRLSALAQYRADFLIGMTVSFSFASMAPLFQFLIYVSTRGFPGWRLDDVLVFQAMLLLTTGLRDLLLGDIRRQIDHLAEKGEFDRLLLKPAPPLVLVLTAGFSPYSLGTTAVGAGLLAWTWERSGAALTATAAGLFAVFLAAGILLALSVNTLYCALTVRWTHTSRLGETMDKVMRFGDYPIEVFPGFVRAVFTTVLPLSVAAYWPASAVLGRVQPVGLVAVLGAVLAFLAALLFWKRQLFRYASSGG